MIAREYAVKRAQQRWYRGVSYPEARRRLVQDALVAKPSDCFGRRIETAGQGRQALVRPISPGREQVIVVAYGTEIVTTYERRKREREEERSRRKEEG